MRRSRFSEEQIASILSEGSAGLPVSDICRKYQILIPTCYQWKSKNMVSPASDLNRIKKLEDENLKLKQMYADMSLEFRLLKDIVDKKYKKRQKGEVL